VNLSPRNHADEDSARLRIAMVAAFSDTAPHVRPTVAEAMRTVPREAFAPSYFLPDGPGFRLVRRDDVPAQWLAQAYHDHSLATQLDGTVHADSVAPGAGPWQGAPTCSASQPSLVAGMLDLLAVDPGMRVLEIGTGTGYNAALLCELTEAGGVFTVEYDPSLAAKAEARLKAAGYSPTVIVGDGGMGLPDAAPFDRIITTCSFPAVSASWLAQLSPNGRAVVNLITGIPVGILAVLTRDGAEHGVGGVVAQRAWFMATRTSPSHHALDLMRSADLDEAAPRPTSLRWTDVVRADGLYVLAALRLDAHLLVSFTEDGQKLFSLLADDGSAASQQGSTVVECGPRKLWRELEDIARDWSRLGEPSREDLDLSIRFDSGNASPAVIHRASGWTSPATGITA
jgi:protein-L-isoaspartate O-methyltransferase